NMTAVELTLDVAQSRSAPGVEPPVLSTNDKINTGRFVQVRDASNTHERAMLIVRQAQPTAFAGELILTPMNARVEAFVQETPAAGQVALPNPQVLANGTIPATGARFFVQGVNASAAVRDSGFQLGLRNVEADGDRILMTTVQLELIAQSTAAAPALNFVRVGLWDDAFSAATGALLNNQAAANNFIERDARKFYLRLRDASQAGEARLRWRTLFNNGADDDAAAQPNAQDITLTETANGSGIFISRAVMLVTDETDRDQAIDSGLPAGHTDTAGAADAGNRNRGQSDHRTRMIRVNNTHQLDNRTLIEQVRPAPNATRLQIIKPVFERAPEERRRIRIHLVNVRSSVGGAGILTNARRDLVFRTFQEIYAVCGIFAEVNEIVIDPPASCIGWTTRYPTDPLAADPSVEESGFAGGFLVPSASQTDIFNAIRGRADFDANDVYVVSVAHIYRTPLPAPPGPGLQDASGGIGFGDVWVAAGSLARSFAFVAVSTGVTEYADVHEATHITTNLRNVSGGHFDLGPAGAAAEGNIDGKNLMHRFFLTNARGVSNPKRLWNRQFTNTNLVPNLVLPAQIDSIRASRFVRNF
ncbi:MAG: hypothetical protein KDE54_11135, partial [Caldilineaceae bacterium]|nr:hypothetical protein [Caldilineaceae bacterium]MCB0144043.1 hypothetical protein [Caldilineaceae bacterium]